MAATELASKRFRGFLPVVIDVETGGFHSRTDALLEIAAVIIEVDAAGRVRRGATHAFHVKPFEGSRHGSGLARGQRHRPLAPAAPGHRRSAMRCSGCSARSAPPSARTAAGAPFSWATTPRSTWDSSTPRWSAPASSAIPSTRSPASTPRRWPARRWARRCWRGRRSCRRHRLGQPRRRIRRVYDAERTADLFCHVCNAHARELRARRGKGARRWAGRTAHRRRWIWSRATQAAALVLPRGFVDELLAARRSAVICMAMSQPPISSPLT